MTISPQSPHLLIQSHLVLGFQPLNFRGDTDIHIILINKYFRGDPLKWCKILLFLTFSFTNSSICQQIFLQHLLLSALLVIFYFLHFFYIYYWDSSRKDIHLFIWLVTYVDSWIFIFLIKIWYYSLFCDSNSFCFDHWDSFRLMPVFIQCGFSLSVVLLWVSLPFFGIQGVFICSNSEIISPKNHGSYCWRIVFRNQYLGCSCAPCCSGVTDPRPSQRTSRKKSIYFNVSLHSYLQL